MNKLNCVIIDDEQQCVNILQKMIEKYFTESIDIVGVFTNPIEALKQMSTLHIDILFCDVEMPRLSGIDLVNSLGNKNIEVVFTTAHSKYALEAIKVQATDYLVKPFSKDDLIESVEKCKTKIERNTASSIKTFSADNQSIKVNIHLSNGTIQFIDSKDIIYIESQSNYSHFILNNKPKLIVSKTLKEFDELLTPYGFFRTHHSYLVNLQYIDYYIGGTEEALKLTNGDTVYISRRRKQEFLERMK